MKTKNIRQIGQVKGNSRVYIEDYAMTFLKQLSVMEGGGSAAYGHRMAVLVGRREKEEEAYYIYGALDFPVDAQGSGYRMGTSTWTGIYAGMKQHFPEWEILGWYLTREETDVEQEEWVLRFHQEYFTGEHKVFFYYNPAELEERMYLYEDGRLKKQGGYFIFYEKNEAMQNLLIARNQEFGPAKKVSVLAETVRSPMERVTDPLSGERGAPERSSLEPEERVVREIRRTIEAKQEMGQGTKKEKQTGQTSRWSGVAVAVLLLALCALGYGSVNRMNGLEETIRQMASQLDSREEPSGAAPNTDETDSDGSVLELETLPGGVGIKPEKDEEDEGIKEDEQEEDESEEDEPMKEEEQEEEKPVIEVETEPEEAADEPAAAPEPVEETVAAGPLSYVVKSGDTLLGICLRQYQDGSMVEKVMEANGLTDPDGIFVGDVLILPES